MNTECEQSFAGNARCQVGLCLVPSFPVASTQPQSDWTAQPTGRAPENPAAHRAPGNTRRSQISSQPDTVQVSATSPHAHYAAAADAGLFSGHGFANYERTASGSGAVVSAASAPGSPLRKYLDDTHDSTVPMDAAPAPTALTDTVVDSTPGLSPDQPSSSDEEWPLPLGPLDLLDQVLSSCGPDDYALLGPVGCSDIYRLCDLLDDGGHKIRRLYVAVQRPYRQCDSAGRTTQAICRLAEALATSRDLKGLVLRFSDLELSKRQVKKIALAFAKALRVNETLTNLHFKPPGYFAGKGIDMAPLIEAGQLSDSQRMAILGGMHPRTGRYSCLRSLPQEILQRLISHCDCNVSND